jgi:hypothetical protein
MNRRSTFLLLLSLVVGLPRNAGAQGRGNGNGRENENSGNGPNGNNSGPRGNSNGPRGNSSRNNSSAVGAGGELSESEALAAVQSGRAVPLESILPDLRRRTGGDVINAKLQLSGNFLIYALKVLTPGGKVITEYYYARSGLPVRN